MLDRTRTLLLSSAAITALSLGGPAMANAASHHHKHATRQSTASGTSAGTPSGSSSGETALTGATLTSASNAAIAAVPGGTVDGATTETDATGAYEVHVTKSDGSQVKVIEDASFNVLSVTAGGAGCH